MGSLLSVAILEYEGEQAIEVYRNVEKEANEVWLELEPNGERSAVTECC